MPLTLSRRRWAVLAMTALLAPSAIACGSGNAAQKTEAGKTIIEYQSYSGQVDMAELADALGFFEEVELERVGDVQGGPESLRAAATGQTSYGAAFNGAIAKLVSTGAPLTSVVSYYGSNAEVNASILTLAGGDVRAAEDLVGGKVAVNTLGANAEAVIDTWLREEGLSEEQIDGVTLVPLPQVTMEEALRSGQVDAIYTSAALKELTLAHGGVREVVNDVDLVGPYDAGAFVMREDFIAQNPEATEDFVQGVARAVEYTQTHSAEQVRKIATEYLEEDGRADFAQNLTLWKGSGVNRTGGVIADEDYELWIDWLEAEGEIDADSLDVGDVYTNDFNPYAQEAS